VSWICNATVALLVSAAADAIAPDDVNRTALLGAGGGTQPADGHIIATISLNNRAEIVQDAARAVRSINGGDFTIDVPLDLGGVMPLPVSGVTTEIFESMTPTPSPTQTPTLPEGTTAAPETAATPSPETVPVMACQSIKCSDQCNGRCGWSRRHSVCVAGAYTNPQTELGLGDCSPEITTATTSAPRTTAAAPELNPPEVPPIIACRSVRCSDQCNGQCGWSRRHSACVAGAYTNPRTELGLGEC
jgi:hypothetical protein